MAKIEKYSTGILGVIKHNIREFKDGRCPTNLEVDPERKKNNYSILRRGNTAKDIERYRKNIEKECFKYNRKNIVHANEVICTLPSDCPPEQEERFFEESFKYICSTLPMGERCVFLAEVHADEGRVLKDGSTVVEGAKHLHVMYVPAVPDTKHDGYDFKLCSDQLTKRAVLKQWHPNYQHWLDEAGVKATVASGVTSGKGISVKSLKEITKQTGLSFEQIKSLEKENKKLYDQLYNREQELAASHKTIKKQDSIITQLKEYLLTKDSEIDELKGRIASKENALLRTNSKQLLKDQEYSDIKSRLAETEKENQQLRLSSQKLAAEKDSQLQEAYAKLHKQEQELQLANRKIHTLETKQVDHTATLKEKQNSWDKQSSWGNDPGWGNPRSYEEERTW